ncbi:spore cortex-lytic enzyme SleB [Heliorestis acidaminivorans]|uniref:Spore cortex-lytic enzyme SleB n=1 Tax=Heliorestis acidaminivorans TaxID=553427 RepID=A0A6I0F3V3_9FIRM|nr:spore cortex-lytic enzyme SleB [Heliorestis acidaminivorans]
MGLVGLLGWSLWNDSISDLNQQAQFNDGVSVAQAQEGAVGYPKESDLQMMARAIHGEARGEPYEGQVAVGAVIINRIRHPSFPNTAHGVIFQPRAFTAVDDGQIWIPLPEDASAHRAARDALAGWDPSGGCLYYWNPATATSQWIWTRTIVKRIGKHNFGL